MSARRYPLTYEVRAEDPPLTPAEIEPGRGACDAAILLSLVYPDDGSFSLLIVSMDGRTGDHVSDAELFKCWTLVAKRLAESTTLHASKRELARELWQIVVDAMQRRLL
jgi:hypothetical protein